MLLYAYPNYLRIIVTFPTPTEHTKPTTKQTESKKEQATPTTEKPTFIGPTGQPFVIGPDSPPPE